MRIAILAVQGAFIEHERILQKLCVDYFEIRQQKDLDQEFNGLILPGGESTVMGKLLHNLGLYEPLKAKIQDGLPVLGTCAGLILLASRLCNDSKVHFGTLPVVVKRNAYGRQLGSFYTTASVKGIGEFPMTFIRAPYIDSISDGVDLLSIVDGNIVAVEYKNQIGLAFHPELTSDLSLHTYFIEKVKAYTLSLSA